MNATGVESCDRAIHLNKLHNTNRQRNEYKAKNTNLNKYQRREGTQKKAMSKLLAELQLVELLVNQWIDELLGNLLNLMTISRRSQKWNGL